VLKRLSATLLAGPLFLGLIPTAANAAPARPAEGATSSEDDRTIQPSDHRDDDHYRCYYRCGDRDRHDRYRYERDRYRYDRCRYGSDRSRYGRCRYNRAYHDGECWYHDGDRWRRCRGYRS
jgi:hypothetical protein